MSTSLRTINALGMDDSGVGDDNFYDLDISEEIKDEEIGSFVGNDFLGKRAKARRQKKKEERRKAGKPVGIKERLAKVGQKLSEKGINPIYAPLVPMKPVLRAMLKKRGIENPPKKVAELARFIYDKFVAKKDGENFAISATAIVSAVIALLNGIKKKVEETPEAASSFELGVAKNVKIVESQIEETATDSIEESVGEKIIGFISSPWGIALTALGVTILGFGVVTAIKK